MGLNIGQPETVHSSLYGRRIAYKNSVAAQTVGNTALTFEAGLSLNNAVPSFALVKYHNGTFDSASITVDIGSNALCPASSLVGLAAGTVAILNLSATVDIVTLTDTLQVNVAVGNSSGSAFDIDVFGFVYAS
jgi:hypothetical protein